MQADLATSQSALRCRPIGAVVTPQHRWIGATFGGQAVEFADEVLAGEAVLGHSAEASAGVRVSAIETILIGRPSVLTPNWKSIADTAVFDFVVPASG